MNCRSRLRCQRVRAVTVQRTFAVASDRHMWLLGQSLRAMPMWLPVQLREPQPVRAAGVIDRRQSGRWSQVARLHSTTARSPYRWMMSIDERRSATHH